MATELTIQHVEGMTRAVDKMSTAFRSLKLSVGSVKGTNVLKEMQAVVAGVNKLDSTMRELDTKLSTSLGKLVAQMATLPTEFANALGSGAGAVRVAGAKISEAAADGLKDGLSDVRAARKALQAEYEAISKAAALGASTPLQGAALKDYRSRGANLFPEDRAALAKLLREERELEQALRRLGDRQKEANILAANARNASLSAGQQLVTAARKVAADQVTLNKEESLRYQQWFKDKAERVAKEQALDANQRNASLSAGQQLVRVLRNRAKEELEAREVLAKAATMQFKADRWFAAAQPKDSGVAASNKAMGDTPAKAAAASKALKTFSIDANDAHSAARGLASGFNLLWLTWGNLGPLLAGAAISNGFMQTLKMGLQVNSLLEQTRVLGQESAEAMRGLSNQMIALAERGPYGVREIAEAMKTLTLAGLDAVQVGKALPAVLDFAVAGDTDIKLAAETVTSVATAFRMSADAYSIVGDAIAKTAAVSKASVEDMAEAFKASTVLHKQFGASLTDVSLGLALLSNLGIKGSAAGVALRNMYVDLAGRTPQVAKTLKALGINVLDADGKFLSFYDTIKEVAKGLDNAGSGAERMALRQKILSERGMKPAIEALDQLKRGTEGYTDALKRMEAQVADRAGFSGLAAANLALTNANQIKSVFTTLQASAMKAFDSIEPMIYGVSRQLREAFASKEFVNGLTTLMKLVGNLTSLLVENGKAVLILAGAYASLKGAQLVVGVFSAMSASLASMSAGLVAARLAATGVGPALAVAGAAGATFSTAATAVAAKSAIATTALGTFATIGSRVLAFLSGPWGLAMAAAATAYGVYTTFANKAADAKDRFSGEKSKAFTDNLKERTEQVKRETAAILAGEDVRLAEDKADANKVIEATLKRVAEAQGVLTQKTKETAAWQQALDKSLAKGLQHEITRNSVGLRFAKEREKQAKDELDNVKKLSDGERTAADEFISANREKEAAVAKMAKAEEERIKKLFGNGTGTGLPADPAKTGRQDRSNELAIIEKMYADETATIEKALSNQRALLESKRKNDLISEAEFGIRMLGLTERAEQAKLNVIDKYATRYSEAYAKLKAKTKGQEAENLQNVYNAFSQRVTGDQAETQDAELLRVAQLADTAAGSIKAMTKEYEDFWAKDDEKKGTKTAAAQMSEDLSGAAAIQAAFKTAAESAMSDYDEAIAKVQAQLRSLTEDYEAVEAVVASAFSGAVVSDAQLAQVKSLEDRLKLALAQLEKLKAAQAGAGESAGLGAIFKKLTQGSDDVAARGYDRSSRALAGLVNSFKQLAKAQEEAAEGIKKYEDAISSMREKGDDKGAAKATKELDQIRKASAAAELRNIGNIVAASKTFFKEGSKGYKTLEKAEKAFRAMEFALSVKSMFQKVTEWAFKLNANAVGHTAEVAASNAAEAAKMPAKIAGIFAACSSQLGIFGPAAAAAIVAAIGLSAAGKSRGSFAKPNEGTGTVFGDKDAKSASVNNSIEALEKNSSIELRYSAAMLNSLKTIEANIGGITNQILRSNAQGDTATRLGTGNSTSVSAGGMAISGGLIGLGLRLLGDSIPLIGKINQALFGSKTTVKGSGLMAGDQSLASILSGGLNLQDYADVNKTKKFFGVTYSNKNSTVLGNADATLTKQFTLVFQEFYKSIQLAAAPLGENLDVVKSTLDNFVVSIGKIDLQGLTGEQIQEKLAAVLGAAADNLASAAIPGFEAFQKVGEGYFETIVRLANASETAQNALKRFGVSMVSLKDLANKQGDVTLELIRESLLRTEVVSSTTKQVAPPGDMMGPWPPQFTTVIENVYTGVGKILETFQGSADELLEVYGALLKVREGLRAIGKDAQALSLAMIEGAGGLEQLQTGLQDYYDNFLTKQEQVDDMTRRLSESFAKAGVAMPASVEGFKNLVKGLDLSTEAGQTTFGQIIALSGGFYDLMEAMKETESAVSAAAKEREELTERLAKAQDEYNKVTMTSAQYAELQRQAIDASNLALYDQIVALEAATEAARKAATERTSLQEELNNLTMTEADLLAIRRAALEESNRALFDQVQAAKLAKAIDDERKGLQQQLNELTLTEVQLLALQREAIHESNRALFDQVQAAKAAAVAAEEAAARLARVADQRYGLETRLLELQGDTAKLRERELAQLEPENRELQERIWKLEDEQKATEEAAKAAEEAAQAATKLKEAWQDAADGILEEVRRIRGVTGSPQATLASAQAQFSLAVAKAQAGDVDAAKELPKLSQNLLEMANKNARSAEEAAFLQASTLGALERTLRIIEQTQGITVPAFANGGMHTGGLRIVGEREPELEATGAARIYNGRQLRAALAGGSNDSSEVVALLLEVKALLLQMTRDQQAYGGANAVNTAKLVKMLRDVIPDGDYINVKTVTEEAL